MYNINQLNQMSEEQLRELAKSMGLKRVDSFDHDSLVYEVLDHQAETEAANAPEPTKRRRERIRQPAAKANGNEVTKDDAVATKNKKKKQDITEEPKVEEAQQKPADEVADEQPAAVEQPKRKRGRPSAAEKAARELEAAAVESQEDANEKSQPAKDEKVGTAEEPATKRRGRGRSKKQAIEEPVLPFDNMDAIDEQPEPASGQSRTDGDGHE